MSRDDQTIGVYDAKVEDYVAASTDFANDPILAEFLKALPQGGTVLDLGCGPGLSSAHMAQAGFQVTATDASAEMIEHAKTFDGVTAQQATFDEIEGQDLYDGIWANFSLLHAARDDMPRYLSALNKALKPGGLFHIALKTGTGAKRDDIGRQYTFFTGEELTALLEGAGFSPQSQVTGVDKGLAGTVDPWIAISARG